MRRGGEYRVKQRVNNGRNIHPSGLWQGKFGCLKAIGIVQLNKREEGINENRRIAILHVCGLT